MITNRSPTIACEQRRVEERRVQVQQEGALLLGPIEIAEPDTPKAASSATSWTETGKALRARRDADR
jgi:hypothetical protein